MSKKKKKNDHRHSNDDGQKMNLENPNTSYQRGKESQDMKSRKERVLECAIAYAELGWQVIPLWSVDDKGKCLCGRKGCKSPGKHPHGKLTPHGLKDGTTDRAAIASWFGNGEELNVAICTGSESNLVVLDVDKKNSGVDSLAKVEAKCGKLPQTAKSKTGGGGFHYCFNHPGGKVGNSASEIAEGLDIRGDDGYIVAPPSLHASGKEYQWAIDPGSGLAECPKWLLSGSNKKKAYSTSNGLASIPDGKRNDTLTKIAGSLRRKGWSIEEIETALQIINTNRCKPPLDEAEVTGIARSAENWEPGQITGVAGDIPYIPTGHGLIYLKPTKNGPVQVPLTNFTAKIVADVVRDDGAETCHHLEIEVEQAGKVRTVGIPALQFSSMNWPMEKVGASTIVYAGYGAKDHARAAIQMLSDDISPRTVYTHCGWRKVDDKWVYLHGGGAIGSEGVVGGIEVDFGSGLDKYTLVEPENDEDLKKAIQASLKILELVPDKVGYPLLCATFAAVLGNTGLSIHVVGKTGAGKTELAALCQQHYGPTMDSKHLPGSWMSTGNAIEGLAFVAKDALLVVDDFAPGGGRFDVQRLHSTAARILRAQGNHAGRQRMRSDATLRPEKPPRGLILSTGEDVPKGQSVRARALIVEVGPKDLDWNILTACQKEALEGLYVKAMWGFITWIASRYESIKKTRQERIAEFREKIKGKKMHQRTPETIAISFLGMEHFLCFAVAKAAISVEEAEELRVNCWKALLKAAKAQEPHQAASEPAQRFLELISSAWASGRAHLASPDGGMPPNPSAFGWRQPSSGWNEPDSSVWKPQGDRIGWTDGQAIYLDPDASYRVAENTGGSEALTVTGQILRKRLNEMKFIKIERQRKTLTVRRKLEGTDRRVLFLSQKGMRFLGIEPDKPDIPDNNSALDAENADSEF